MTGAAGAAIREGWPVWMTSAVVGATFGILAHGAGLTLVETSAMSVVVFAGAAQFATLELLRGGAGAPAIVLAIFLINTRHALMGAAIRPYVERTSVVRRLALGYILTDEAFAMGIGWFRRGHRDMAYYAVFGAGMWLSWNIATIAGATLGANVERPERFGIDFAITAVFVAIVALSARHRTDVAVAVAAAVVAAALKLAGASTIAVLAAGALAPLLALSRPADRA